MLPGLALWAPPPQGLPFGQARLASRSMPHLTSLDAAALREMIAAAAPARNPVAPPCGGQNMTLGESMETWHASPPLENDHFTVVAWGPLP